MTVPLTIEERIAVLEKRDDRRRIGGLMIWLIVLTVGAGFYAFVTGNTNDQTRGAINTSVCGFRALLAPQLASYVQAAQDETLSESAQKRNNARIKTTRAFLATQLTVPRSFDCSKILNAAPPE